LGFRFGEVPFYSSWTGPDVRIWPLSKWKNGPGILLPHAGDRGWEQWVSVCGWLLPPSSSGKYFCPKFNLNWICIWISDLVSLWAYTIKALPKWSVRWWKSIVLLSRGHWNAHICKKISQLQFLRKLKFLFVKGRRWYGETVGSLHTQPLQRFLV
jgi:hypothetical protein